METERTNISISNGESKILQNILLCFIKFYFFIVDNEIRKQDENKETSRDESNKMFLFFLI
jgi:hypothetical protein